MLLVGPDLKCNQSIAVDKTCVNGDPWKPHFALNSSIVGLKNNTDIQRELLEHGPVTAAFKVFEDFFHYKSGVYNGCSPPANQSRKVAGKVKRARRKLSGLMSAASMHSVACS